MADKILNTRILLKQAELSAWEQSTLPLKKGEIVFATVAATAGNGLTEPVVMAKVCTEEGKTFSQLPWSFYAKAADVYDWAKEETLTINKDGTGNVVSGIEWDATANGGKGGIKFTTAAVATAEGLAEIQKEIYGNPANAEGKSRIDLIEENITLNAPAWEHNTTYDFKIEGNNLIITDSDTQSPVTVPLVTDEELTEILKGYVTVDTFNDTIGTQTNARFETVEGAIDGLLENKADKSTTYTKTEVDDLVQGAKDYADTNDANETFAISYDKDAGKIYLTGSDGTNSEIPTADFIKDGMINTVTIGDDNDLVITFNTDAGKENIVLPLDQLVDIYTGSEGTNIKVTVTSDKKIEADLTDAVKASLAKADSALQDASAFDTAGAAAQALTDAKADTTAQIEALKLGETYEPIGAENRAKAYADGLAGNYDAAGSADNALETAKAYTDELANGTVKTNSDKIAALEALDYILNGDTVILDCGGAE